VLLRFATVPNASLEKMNVAVFAADRRSLKAKLPKPKTSKKIVAVGRDPHVVLIAGTYSRAVGLASTISTFLSEPAKGSEV
jgi:hypothetical protein